MGYIYAYAPDEDDCSSIGIVGALLPTECSFSLEAGAFGELTLKHPKDTAGKWKSLQTGVILKAPVPVRLCPAIRADGTYITTVETWSVSSTATSADRALYKTVNKDKKTTTLPASQTVTVLETSFTYERTKVKATVITTKRKKKVTKNYSGWIKTDVLENKISEQMIPATSSGAEEANASYAVRDQLFRIYDVTVSDDDNGTVDVKARRIVYDLLGNLCTYVNTGAEITGLQACQGILSNTIADHDFSIYSDIADTRSALDCRDINPIEALCAEDTGVVARWNAEIVSDDYDIYVLHQAGMDCGVSILYGKNLTGISCEVDTSEVALGIRPRGEKKDSSPLYLDGTETLPSGYEFGDGGVIYASDTISDYAIPKISPLTVSDAKIGDDVSEKLAKQRMIEQAVEQFEGACNSPEIKLSVDFVMLGDTAEYSQYRHLESLFVYDTVHIKHQPLGISSDIALVSMEWDCIAEKVIKAEFGSLQDVSSSVASWQISSVSGGKIVPGTVSGSALKDDIISARHIQSESINTDALQANSVTAAKLAAGAVTADKIQANTIETASLNAVIAKLESLTADDIETDRFTAAIASLGVLTAGDASIRKAVVESLLASALTVTDATEANVYIDNLMVKSAQMIEATIGTLICKASDGRYYRLDFDDSGTITPVEVTVTDDEITAGTTSDGTRRIVETAMTVDDLGASSFKAISALINRLTADQIDVGTLFANEAFISQLNTSAIYGGKSFEVIVGNISDEAAAAKESATSANTAAQSAASAVNNLQIGGRNLVRNSAFDDTGSTYLGYSYWTAWGSPATREFVTDSQNKRWCHITGSGDARWQGINQNTITAAAGISIKPDTSYRFSARVKGGAADQVFVAGFHWLDSSGNIITQNWGSATVGTSEQRVEFQFTSGSDTGICGFNLMIGVDSATAAFDVYFTDIMFEQGTKSSSWQLAQEDTEASIDTAQSTADQASAAAATTASTLQRAIRFDADTGLHVGDNQTSNEVLIDSESVNIVMNGQKYSKFGANYVQFGQYQLRKSADGGLVFKLKE